MVVHGSALTVVNALPPFNGRVNAILAELDAVGTSTLYKTLTDTDPNSSPSRRDIGYSM